jgi:hypothetical protein
LQYLAAANEGPPSCDAAPSRISMQLISSWTCNTVWTGRQMVLQK